MRNSPPGYFTQTGLLTEYPVYEPAWCRFVLLEDPEPPAVRMVSYKIVPGIASAVPPAGFYALGAGQEL